MAAIAIVTSGGRVVNWSRPSSDIVTDGGRVVNWSRGVSAVLAVIYPAAPVGTASPGTPLLVAGATIYPAAPATTMAFRVTTITLASEDEPLGYLNPAVRHRLAHPRRKRHGGRR